MEKATACGICNNAYVDAELQEDGDLSYTSLGECESGYRVFFRSGDSRPTEILFEKWYGKAGWHLVGYYRPKYCPNCGRKLIENNSLKTVKGRDKE